MISRVFFFNASLEPAGVRGASRPTYWFEQVRPNQRSTRRSSNVPHLACDTRHLVVTYTPVLFDLDHTLLDTDTSLELAFVDAMQVAGFAAEDHVDTFSTINSALWKLVEAQELSPDQVHVKRFEQLNRQRDLRADPQQMADAFAHGMGANGDLYPGARPVLEALARITPLAMVTNGLSHIQRARIERLELAQYFTAITISAEVGVAKPDPAIFDHTFAELGQLDRAGALMVGDSLSSDIAGGINGGLATCWYNPGRSPSGESPASHEINDLDQLIKIVSGT